MHRYKGESGPPLESVQLSNIQSKVTKQWPQKHPPPKYIKSDEISKKRHTSRKCLWIVNYSPLKWWVFGYRKGTQVPKTWRNGYITPFFLTENRYSLLNVWFSDQSLPALYGIEEKGAVDMCLCKVE
jgi:hypothetical protein